MTAPKKKRGGWSNAASAENGQQGGRLPTRFALSRPAALYLRELTRSRLGRKDVTQAHMGAVLEEILTAHAQQTSEEDADARPPRP